jgi:hypothetical protein
MSFRLHDSLRDKQTSTFHSGSVISNGATARDLMPAHSPLPAAARRIAAG